MIGIYKITSPSGRIYIGQSTKIEKRKLDYKTLSKCKGQTKLYHSILKYGWDNHIFEVVEECKQENLNERERYWQDYFNCLKIGLNCKLTETSDKSGKISEETRKRMSISSLGKLRTEESKRKQSLAKKGKPGYKHSEKSKKKMSLLKKGKKLSVIHILNMSNSLKGKKPGNCKKVIDIVSNIIYTDIQKAADSVELTYAKLHNMLSGKTINKTSLAFLK